MPAEKKSLNGKVAIVTGGTKGIGRGIADLFRKEGAKVIVADISEEKMPHHYIKCDVSNFENVSLMVKEAIKKFKKIDILVNNAGIYPFKSLAEMSEDDWDRVININLKSVFLCTKSILPYMKGKDGRIVNISSIAGTKVGFPGLVHYCATKAGILGFTRAAALELAKDKIRVNAIAPGSIDTPGTESLRAEVKSKLVNDIPLERSGLPIDIAEAALYLASDASNYVTGEILTVDGGWTVK